MKPTFEKIALQICSCGAPKPHAYFYADPEIGEATKFPFPFTSIEGVEVFIDAHVTTKLISPQQKQEMMKVAKECGLQEKMDEDELLNIVPLAEEIVVMGDFGRFSKN